MKLYLRKNPLKWALVIQGIALVAHMKRYLPKGPLEWACAILVTAFITLMGWWGYVLGVIGFLLIIALITYNSNILRKEWNNNPPR